MVTGRSILQTTPPAFRIASISNLENVRRRRRPGCLGAAFQTHASPSTRDLPRGDLTAPELQYSPHPIADALQFFEGRNVNVARTHEGVARCQTEPAIRTDPVRAAIFDDRSEPLEIRWLADVVLPLIRRNLAFVQVVRQAGQMQMVCCRPFPAASPMAIELAEEKFPAA
jgi:hypothetical protein